MAPRPCSPACDDDATPRYLKTGIAILIIGAENVRVKPSFGMLAGWLASGGEVG